MLSAMGPKVNRYCFMAAAALAATVFAACSLHPGRGVKACKYRFQALTFSGLDGSASHWRMDVAVTNPNAREVTLNRMRYALLYESDTLLTGWNPEKRLIPAKDSQVVATTLDLPNAILKRLPAGIWSQTDAKFKLVADAYVSTWVGDIVVPYAINETVHINMTEQVAKYRDLMMKRFFGWPGNRLNEGGIVGPDTSAPRDLAPPGSPGRPDEHL
jgi:hypothetical protein